MLSGSASSIQAGEQSDEEAMSDLGKAKNPLLLSGSLSTIRDGTCRPYSKPQRHTEPIDRGYSSYQAGSIVRSLAPIHDGSFLWLHVPGVFHRLQTVPEAQREYYSLLGAADADHTK